MGKGLSDDVHTDLLTPRIDKCLARWSRLPLADGNVVESTHGEDTIACGRKQYLVSIQGIENGQILLHHDLPNAFRQPEDDASAESFQNSVPTWTIDPVAANKEYVRRSALRDETLEAKEYGVCIRVALSCFELPEDQRHLVGDFTLSREAAWRNPAGRYSDEMNTVPVPVRELPERNRLAVHDYGGPNVSILRGATVAAGDQLPDVDVIIGREHRPILLDDSSADRLHFVDAHVDANSGIPKRSIESLEVFPQPKGP